jgi:hypothetical protein
MDDFLGTAIQHAEEQIKQLEQEHALCMEQTAQRLIACGFLDSDYDGSSGEFSDAPNSEFDDSDSQDDGDFVDSSASTEDLYDFSVGSTENILEPIDDAVKQNQNVHPVSTRAENVISTHAASPSSAYKAVEDTETKSDSCSEAEDDEEDEDELYGSSECEEIEENVPLLVYNYTRSVDHALRARACNVKVDEDSKYKEAKDEEDEEHDEQAMDAYFKLKHLYYDDEEDKENRCKAEEAIFDFLNHESLRIEHELVVIDGDDRIYGIIHAYFQ